MKTRNGFVSNSSSASFVVHWESTCNKRSNNDTIVGSIIDLINDTYRFSFDYAKDDTDPYFIFDPKKLKTYVKYFKNRKEREKIKEHNDMCDVLYKISKDKQHLSKKKSLPPEYKSIPHHDKSILDLAYSIYSNTIYARRYKNMITTFHTMMENTYADILLDNHYCSDFILILMRNAHPHKIYKTQKSLYKIDAGFPGGK